MTIVERFLKYVAYDTQSSEESTTVPTTSKQKVLGAILAQELDDMGLHHAHLDEFGYVYAWLPATPGLEDVPTLGLIAHMDTSPSASGTNVKPRVVTYGGGVLPLGGDVVLDPKEFEHLATCIGQDLIVTDGTTLLGADDKAGVAEIFTAMEHLMTHPEIPHGRIAIGITPDEEVGAGANHFDIEKFGAAAAYTVDGGVLGELEWENFNAATAHITVHGVNIHPGSAKNKMKHASLIALELAGLLPPWETPGHTEGYEGFYHLCHMEGDETLARLHYIIRDHDRERFEGRKATLEQVVDFLNARHGKGTVVCTITDSYYNMKEPLAEHMYLIDRAKAAFLSCAVTPIEVPIRGGTDGARLSYRGLPCPNLSTGGLNFHGVHEYIPVASLEKMVEVLVALVQPNSGSGS